MIPGCCCTLHDWRPLLGKALPERPGIWSTIYSIDETKRAQSHKCKRHRVAGCLFRGAAELKFCLAPKGAAAKAIWQHVAENPRVAASANFPDCKKATFKFHICRIPRGCRGQPRHWWPFGLPWRRHSQAWQLYLLSCTCELQSRWASVRRRPPGYHHPPTHDSHVAFEGGRTGNQMKQEQQCKTTVHSICHCLPGLGVWPTRLLVQMWLEHLGQSRALYRLGPWVFNGPSRWSGPSRCYCRSVATAKTINSNEPAMQRTAHSSLRWLPAGIWSHRGGRAVGITASRCRGQSCWRAGCICLQDLRESSWLPTDYLQWQVLTLPAHRQDLMKQAWTAQVTDFRAFNSRFVIAGR